MNDDTLVPFMGIFGAAAMIFFVVWYAVAAGVLKRRRLMARRMAADESDRSIIREDYLAAQLETGWGGRLDTGFTRMITRTGLDLDPSVALGIVVFCGVALGASVFVWRSEQEPWLAIPAFFLGCAVPLTFFAWRQNAHRRVLQHQLPDTIYLLARSLRAGRSLEQAFHLIGEQGLPPLSREFARMHRQLELGLSLQQVLHSTADRLGLVDFNVFSSVLLLHRATGGSLPNLLDRLGNSVRDRNHFEGQFRAATVLGRYSAAFIGLMVCVILTYLFFFHREWALRFFDTTNGYTGLALFSTAMGMEVLGGVLLYWLLRYDY